MFLVVCLFAMSVVRLVRVIRAKQDMLPPPTKRSATNAMITNLNHQPPYRNAPPATLISITVPNAPTKIPAPDASTTIISQTPRRAPRVPPTASNAQ